MRQIRSAILAAALFMGVGAQAQEQHSHDHQRHLAATAGDGRQRVDFPPEMREHTLANMRDHLQAIGEILAAMSEAQYAKAAAIAQARLGMESPSAAGCRSESGNGAAPSSLPASMDHRMAEFMPEGMRRIGLDMHQAASAFAGEAAKAGRTGKGRPALAALSRVTRQCTACHAGYRMN